MSEQKEKVIEQIADNKVIPILRGYGPDTCIEIADQFVDAGVRTIEITMDSPQAGESMKRLNETFEDLLTGAGTVRTRTDLHNAREGGARFVLSPVMDSNLIDACKETEIAVVPGCFTPTEVMRALQLGADAIKLFPASSMGPGYLSSIQPPLPKTSFIPTGGITSDNASAYLEAGASAVGVGSFLLSEFDEQGVESVRERAEELLESL